MKICALLVPREMKLEHSGGVINAAGKSARGPLFRRGWMSVPDATPPVGGLFNFKFSCGDGMQSTVRVPTCDELRLPSDHSGGGENHPLARSKATTRLRWRCSRSCLDSR
jgi:hypothetical protein